MTDIKPHAPEEGCTFYRCTFEDAECAHYWQTDDGHGCKLHKLNALPCIPYYQQEIERLREKLEIIKRGALASGLCHPDRPDDCPDDYDGSCDECWDRWIKCQK